MRHPMSRIIRLGFFYPLLFYSTHRHSFLIAHAHGHGNASAFIPPLSLRVASSRIQHRQWHTQLEQSKQNTPKLELESQLESDSEALSRREWIILGIGGTAYAKVVSTAISKIKRGDAYPPEHEDRVAHVFERAILEASGSINNSIEEHSRPLRILEIGIGDTCRTVVRGLYDGAFAKLAQQREQMEIKHPSKIEFMGIDIDTPSDDVIASTQKQLTDSYPSLDISFRAMERDIVNGLEISHIPDGYFDAITCSLVLCSVSDQMRALKEIKRLVRPNGGTFGYVEHVAVRLENESDGNSFSNSNTNSISNRNGNRKEDWGLRSLELQQRVLDPLQQAVAHNCHLHRNTDMAISETFGLGSKSDSGSGDDSAVLLESERFLCNDMWPVSMQCCGVVKVASV